MNTGISANATIVQSMQGLGESQKTLNAAASLERARATRDQQRIEDAAQDFEAVFISEMIKPMFNMVEVNETFGGGKGEEVFRDLMVQEYGKMIAKQGGIGLSAHIKAELIAMQSGQSK
jgi:flagellar protein FlgJ